MNTNIVRNLLITVLFFLVLLIFFKDTIFSSGIPSGGDFIHYQLSVLSFFKEAFREGSFPFWNGLVSGGMPALIYSPIFYPFNWAYMIFGTKIFAIFFYTTHLLIAYVSTYHLSRLFGRSRTSSLLAGLSFILCGFFTLRIYLGHVDLMAAASYIPVIYLLIERYFRGKGAINLVLISIPFSLQILTDHPQIAYYSLLFSALYLIYKLVLVRKDIVKTIALFVLGIGLALGIAGVSLIPSVIHSSGITRATKLPLEEVASFSLPISMSKVSLFPFPFSEIQYFEGTNYISVFVFILSLLGLFTQIRKQRELLYFAILSVIALFMSSGLSTPFFKFFYDFLPGFSSMRAHTRAVVFISLSVSLLAAFGYDYFLEKIKILFGVKYRTHFGASLAVLGIVTTLLSFQTTLLTTLYAKYYLHSYLLVLGIGMFGLGISLLRWLKLELFALIVVLVLSISYFRFDWDYLKPKEFVLTSADKELTSLILNKDPQKEYRVWYEPEISEKTLRRPYEVGLKDSQNIGWSMVPLNYLTFLYGEKSPEQYSSLSRVFQFDLEKLAQFSVRFVATKKNLDSLKVTKIGEVVTKDDTLNVYELNQVLPRFYSQDPSTVVKKISESYNKISLNVTSQTPGEIVVRDLYDPYWEAKVNDSKVVVSPTQEKFRSVSVPNGESKVDFYYSPRPFQLGLGVSGVSLVLLGLLSILLSTKFRTWIVKSLIPRKAV